MATETTTAGYLVDLRFWEQPDQNHTKLFVDADLLTARQATFWYAQTLSAQKPKTEVLDIAIFLTEVKNGEPYPPYIAEVFNRRFHRSEIKLDSDATAIADRLPHPWTLDMTRDDEAVASPKAIYQRLGELTCEYEYYQSSAYSTGLGCMQLTVVGVDNSMEVRNDLSTYTIQELKELRNRFRTPFQTFWLLNDALPYATGLMGQYNSQHAEKNQKLLYQPELTA